MNFRVRVSAANKQRTQLNGLLGGRIQQNTAQRVARTAIQRGHYSRLWHWYSSLAPEPSYDFCIKSSAY